MGLSTDNGTQSIHGRSVGGYMNGIIKDNYITPLCSLPEAVAIQEREKAYG
jgi:hypothetical protein